MRRTSFASMNCSVARTLDVIGDWWTLVIIRDAFLGSRRFDEFQESLGIARNILTDRLNRLVTNGVLERRPYQEHPPRHEYRLTEKGRDLLPVIAALMRWGDRWMAGEAGPPLVLVHRECGHDTQPDVTCSHCGGRLTARNVRAEPGPGASEEDRRRLARRRSRQLTEEPVA